MKIMLLCPNLIIKFLLQSEKNTYKDRSEKLMNVFRTQCQRNFIFCFFKFFVIIIIIQVCKVHLAGIWIIYVHYGK